MSAAVVRLPVVAVEDLTSPSDRFACAPFHAVISARVCLARRGGGRTEDSRNETGRELAPRADELVTARVKLVENTERELARERDRLRASEALAARLRSVGA